MTYFPMFISAPEEKEVLLIGGGTVALQKLSVLMKFDIKVHLIAEKVDFSFYKLQPSGKISIEERKVIEKDIREDLLFVIAATNDITTNRWIAELCNDLKVPVNVVDDASLSTFIFPSILKKGDVVIGVSSGGRVPVITQYIRDKLEETLPDNIEEITEELFRYRKELVKSIPDHKKRAALIRDRIIELLED